MILMKSKIRMCLVSKEKNAKKIEDVKMSLNNAESHLKEHYTKAIILTNIT
jgi:hypothetical protein